MAKILHLKKHKEKGSHEISVLIAAIMQPVMAGGLSAERAEEIYEEIMGNIASLGTDEDGKTAFQTLLDDIISKWYPMANKNMK
jgi:hypothetical protein